MKKDKSLYILTTTKILLFSYFMLVVMSWISFLTPVFYEEYFYNAKLHNPLMGIGGFLFFLFLVLIILHISNIYRTNNKIFRNKMVI